MTDVLLFASEAPLRDVARHARNGSPEEVCGVLVGTREGGVDQAVPITNVARFPRGIYRMDPAEVAVALMEAMARGAAILATYHSHPGGPAWPSSIDVGDAEPGVVYCICDATSGEVGAFTMERALHPPSWRDDDDEFGESDYDLIARRHARGSIAIVAMRFVHAPVEAGG